MQLYTTQRGDWICVARESFGLQPVQLATLCAIVAWDTVQDGEPMPVTELFRAASESDGFYRLNAHQAPGELMRLGLLKRVGPPHQRGYTPTMAGRRRVRA